MKIIKYYMVGCLMALVSLNTQANISTQRYVDEMYDTESIISIISMFKWQLENCKVKNSTQLKGQVPNLKRVLKLYASMPYSLIEQEVEKEMMKYEIKSIAKTDNIQELCNSNATIIRMHFNELNDLLKEMISNYNFNLIKNKYLIQKGMFFGPSLRK